MNSLVTVFVVYKNPIHYQIQIVISLCTSSCIVIKMKKKINDPKDSVFTGYRLMLFSVPTRSTLWNLSKTKPQGKDGEDNNIKCI